MAFRHVHSTLVKRLKELNRAEEMGFYQSNPNYIFQLCDDIQALKTKEETMWKQRSRNDWLRDGDSNMKIFIVRLNQRNKQNFILGLEDENGMWVKDEG